MKLRFVHLCLRPSSPLTLLQPTVIIAIFVFIGSAVFLFIKAKQGPGPYLVASLMACISLGTQSSSQACLSFTTVYRYSIDYRCVASIPLLSSKALPIHVQLLNLLPDWAVYYRATWVSFGHCHLVLCSDFSVHRLESVHWSSANGPRSHDPYPGKASVPTQDTYNVLGLCRRKGGLVGIRESSRDGFGSSRDLRKTLAKRFDLQPLCAGGLSPSANSGETNGRAISGHDGLLLPDKPHAGAVPGYSHTNKNWHSSIYNP